MSKGHVSFTTQQFQLLLCRYTCPSSLFLYPFIHCPVIWRICLFFVTSNSRWITPLYWPLHHNRCLLATRICFIVTKVGQREHRTYALVSSHMSWATLDTWPLLHVGWIIFQSVMCCTDGNYAADKPSLRVSRIFARMFALLALVLPQWH